MIIPAIDLIEGKVVRLYQGDYAQTTEYQLDPIDVVKTYAKAGAEVLHIVDLTGAKDTHKRQIPLIKSMVATGLMRFQSGGGIRSEQDVKDLLEAGVERVVIGSKAVSDRDTVAQWFSRYGSEHIVLALDINIDEHGNKLVATHGWQKDSGVSIDELIAFYQKLIEHYGDSAVICVVYFDDLPIGAGIVLKVGVFACIPWASTLRQHNKLAPNMLLYWSLLSHCADNGVSVFDFGRSTFEEGTYKFKKQWGAEPQLLNWQSFDKNNELINAKSDTESGSSRVREIAENIWRELPLKFTIVTGSILRPYISL